MNLINKTTKEITTVPDEVLTMSSTDLLKIINSYRLEDNKSEMKHFTFMRKIEDELDEAAYIFVGSYIGKDNVSVKCYDLPKDECLQMAMRESKAVRKKCVKELNRLIDEVSDQEKPVIPQTFLEAMQLATNTLVAKELLELENKAQTEQLEANNVLIGNQSMLLEEAEPKVEFYEAVADSDNTFSMTEAAKLLNQKPHAFIGWLRDSGYLTLKNKPMQHVISRGVFVQTMGVDKNKNSYTQARLTTIGLQFIAKKIAKVTFGGALPWIKVRPV